MRGGGSGVKGGGENVLRTIVSKFVSVIRDIICLVINNALFLAFLYGAAHWTSWGDARTATWFLFIIVLSLQQINDRLR